MSIDAVVMEMEMEMEMEMGMEMGMELGMGMEPGMVMVMEMVMRIVVQSICFCFNESDISSHYFYSAIVTVICASLDSEIEAKSPSDIGSW